MGSALTDRGVAKTTLTVTPRGLAGWFADPADLESAVPLELAWILKQVVSVVPAGGTVSIKSVPDAVTTTTAADMLDISRPTLVKLVRVG